MPIPTSGAIAFSDFYIPVPSWDIEQLTFQTNQYSSWNGESYTNPFTSGSGYFVIVYTQTSFNYTGDYQIDYITLGSTSYSFESNATDWKHVKFTPGSLTTFNETQWDGFSWIDLPTGGHIGSTGNNGGWQRCYLDQGTSGGTGTSNIYDGSYCLYTECSYYVWYTKILRSPQFTFTSNQTISWFDYAYGSGMGNRYFYMVKVES
jgi:hypothetical protein